MRKAIYLAALIAFSIGLVFPQILLAQGASEKSNGVALIFGECVGEYSVFLLQNHLNVPIYVRVQRVDYWEEYKKGNMQLGVHFVERVPPEPPLKNRVVGPWDAPPPFRKVVAGAQVRYAVQVPDDKADYRVWVPYMENSKVARHLDEDFENLIKKEKSLVDASWKNVFSGIAPNRCHMQ